MRKKALALVSGGIDSPVAAAMMTDKMDVIALHFSLYPFYCEDSAKLAVKKLVDLKKKGVKKILIVPWSSVLSYIIKEDTYYQCLLCRYGMLKVAETMAKKEKADYVITGEALGQKASQTARNMIVTDSGIKINILRPLIGLDKKEIMDLADKMKISSEKHVGCCSASPSNPVTHGELEKFRELYKKTGIEDKMKKSIDKAIVLDTNNMDKCHELLMKEVHI